jgi:hypothetical protein
VLLSCPWVFFSVRYFVSLASLKWWSTTGTIPGRCARTSRVSCSSERTCSWDPWDNPPKAKRYFFRGYILRAHHSVNYHDDKHVCSFSDLSDFAS